jgi:hypothetical protein
VPPDVAASGAGRGDGDAASDGPAVVVGSKVPFRVT